MLREELEMAVDEKNKHPRHSADVVSFNPLHNKPEGSATSLGYMLGGLGPVI